MVERGRRAEVAFVDERDRQPAPRRRVGRREPVDASADDEEVELFCSETLKVAWLHRENI
jgi:hypothetical protein